MTNSTTTKSSFKKMTCCLFVLLGLWTTNLMAQQGLAPYTPSRTTGITYSSISGTGNNFNFWRNTSTVSTDDNLSSAVDIGFNFVYDGVQTCQFQISTNGFITLLTNTGALGTGTGAYGYQNDNVFTTAGSSVRVIAPFYDDQQTAANLSTLANLQASMKYLTTGVSPNRVLTIEWINMQDFSTSSTSSFNYQVQLFEGSNNIQFNYGTMTYSTTTTMSYSLGLNSSTLAGSSPFATTMLFTQQTANTATFSGTQQNTLGGTTAANMPTTNSSILFTYGGAAPAPMSGTYTVPGSFATMTTLINALNYNGTSGAVTVNITAGSTFTEDVPALQTGCYSDAIIWQKSGVGANPVIRPTGGSGTADFGFRMFGVDNFTWDGIDISEATGSAVEFGLFLSQLSDRNGCQNNTFRNFNVTLNRANTSSTGVLMNSAAQAALIAAGANANNTFQDFSIKNVGSGGVQFNGALAGTYNVIAQTIFLDNNNQINTAVCTNYNIIGDPATPNDISNNSSGGFGIFNLGQKDMTISNCSISNITATSTGIAQGIIPNGTSTAQMPSGTLFSQGTLTIKNNKIFTLRGTGTSSGIVAGIRSNVNANAGTNMRIYNNFIGDLSSASTVTSSRRIVGIQLQDAGTGNPATVEVWHNTVSMTPAGIACSNSCIEAYTTTTGPVNTVKNNIFSNTTASQAGAAKHYCIVTTSATTWGSTGSSSNYNDFNVSGTNGFVGLGSSTDYATVANWTAGITTPAGTDANSISTSPSFTSSTDLHIAALTLNNTGTTAPAYITADIDCQTRPLGGGNFDMGADEIDVCSGTPTAGSITGANSVCTGTGTTLTLTGATSGAGISYQWQSATVSGGPYSNLGTGLTQATGTLTVPTYYVVIVTCTFGSSATTVEKSVLVNALPTVSITPTPGSASICGSGSVSLAATGASTYTWNPTTNLSPTSGTPVSASPTITTTYTVTGTDVNGCTGTASQVVTYNPGPSTPTVTPSSPASVCLGGNQALTASSTTIGTSVLLSEGFESGAPGWSFQDSSSSGTNVPLQIFHIENAPLTDASGSATFSNFSITGAKFAYSNPDLGGSGSNTRTKMISPSFSTVGYSGTGTLSFKHVYRYWSSSSPAEQVRVSISIDGGATWTDLQSYEGSDKGTTTNNGQAAVTTTVNVPAIYMGQSNVQLRWRYISNWGYFWCIDDILLTASPSVNYAWTSTAGSGLPGGAGTPSTSNNSISATPTATGVYAYTVTASIGSCTASATTANVTVNEAPVIGACPGNITQCDNHVATWTDPTATGTPTPTVVCSPLSGSTFATGTTTVNCTATNSCGSSSCSFTVTINESPVISACPSNITQCDNHVATWTDPTATGTPTPTVVCSPLSGSTFATGTTTVNCTATNSCGSSSCSFTVTINESPVIGACPSDITQCDNHVATWTDPTATGTPTPTVVCTPASGSTFAAGTTSVTCTATNSCGSSSCSFNVTINETPVLTCPGNITDATSNPGGMTETYTAPSGGTPSATATCTPPSGSNFPIGTTTVNCSATNLCGTGTCSFTVTITLTCTPPSIGACPSDITQCDNHVATWTDPTATGTPTPTVTCVPASGSTFATGTTSVTCTASNGCAPDASCSFNVTINESPVIGACPGNITQCDNHVATWTDPTATGTPTPTVVCSPLSGSTFATGTTTVNCTATNSCGSSSCSFTVTINETGTAPTSVTTDDADNEICSSGTITLTANGGTFGTPTGSYKWYEGGCGSGSVIGTGPTLVRGPGLSVGTHVYYVRIENSCGNTTCASVSVIVTGNPPAANLPFPTVPAYACNGNNLPASTGSVLYVTTYTWDGPTGTTFNSSGNPYSSGSTSVTVNYGAPNGSGYNICVQGSNACGTTTRRCSFVRGTVNVPGAITPANSRTVECASTSAGYSIAAVTGATSYTWTITGNATVIGSGTSATVNFGAGWAGGNLCVTANTPCYSSAPRCLALTNVTVVPGPMTGSSTACPGSSATYSVPAVSGAATYNWVLPANTSGASSSNSILVNFLSGYALGDIKVSITSICGVTTSQLSKTVASGIPTTPASISGNASGLCGQTVTYSCPSVAGASTYTWTTPGTINSGQNSTSINVTYGSFTSGTVCVTANNACGSSAPRCIPVQSKPVITGNITYSPGTICANQSGVDFQISPVFGTSGYNWNFPSGVSVVLDLANEQIVNWGSSSGVVSVTAANACGNSTKTITITLSCRESAPETIETGSAVTVYPNPAHDRINVQFNASEKTNYTLNLMDLSGRVISTMNAAAQKGVNTSEMDLSTLAKGVYMIEMKSELLNKQIRVVVE